ncbi:hypothetical protein A0H81_02492 [Grifola frondosa]|uniref:Uncharacterized protein n=1 Tax=Grifola frondosa TaxID=5627 RepID=A0A1C7MLI2_GRIFR|nr:hypothetical protein A0H81_02492 [Grifola frondosa]
MKHPSRGGQNLSARYTRLERSLRGKTQYGRDITQLVDEEANIDPRHSRGLWFPRSRNPRRVTNAASLEDYNKAVESLRGSLDIRGIPEDDWPTNIRHHKETERKPNKKQTNAILDAFEELERALKEKKERAKQSEIVGAPDGKPAAAIARPDR